MKILTDIRPVQTAGITQTLGSFLDFANKNKKNVFKIVGVNMLDQKEKTYKKSKKGNNTIISIGTPIPKIKDVLKNAKNLKDVRKKYASVIAAYREAIRKEKPDLVLINGTYYRPWCLFVAAEYESIPMVLHYHGVLSKEIEGWLPKDRKILNEMEKSFDRDNLFYIFPSNITKRVVENEIFGHKVEKSFVLPNPVPLHFFSNSVCGNKINVGIVSRWVKVKNVDFCETLAKYNKDRGGRFVINVVTDLDKKNSLYKNLSKDIKFYSPRSNKRLLDFYKNMGVIISPSYFETYGNVAKEALAAGVPAIVNPNMGVAETFKKLGLGHWVSNFSSVKEIYNKIENIIGSKVKDGVRLKIKEMYSPEKVFNKMISILVFVGNSKN